MSSNESYPQHVVTAVIVAHDGTPWLPQVADAVLGQSRPVQRVVAVDTGSRDRSGAVLASKFGQQAVFGMERSTGYGAAIARALKHRAANAPVPGPGGAMMGGDRVEWLWLLHDDCEPAPDALEQLLRGVAETSSAAVLGPKLRDWTNREHILEAGITLDTAARRVTGIEPREVDQGQHDGDRDALAVSSAGMLVRRDVWEQVGGFDVGMGLFMEDIDFCWRVHSAGYRVRVITDAVAYHAQAATKRKRQVSVGRRDRMLDRRNGLLALLGNLPVRQMLSAAIGNVAVSALRITFFFLAKRLAAAMDEMAALVSVLGHPVRLINMRRRRASGRRGAYARVRADLPSGRSARRVMEFAAVAFSKSQSEAVGSHHASIDPADDDSLLEDNGLARRLLTSPALLTFAVLLAVTLTATRSLLIGGPLGGGSLVPAWGGASDLWRTYLQAFHPSGIGSTTAAPPWLAVVAALSSALAGKPWLAIDVILIGCVPLAGMTAMLAVRRVTSSALVRVWASIAYALLPVATGVVASGRFGSAVAFVLLPVIVLHCARVVTAPRKQASRSAWAAGLLVALAAAFVPLMWVLAVVACALAAIALRTSKPGALRNLAVVVAVAPVLLLPWTLTLFSHPADLLLEAGLPQPGTPVTGLPARALMLLSPGGPGLPVYWVTAGLFFAALAALFARRRRRLITAGWGLALFGLLAAILVSHVTVRPADSSGVVVWAGLPLAVAALGLLLAASAGADGLSKAGAGRKGARAALGGQGARGAVIALVACSAPVLAAASWVSHGVTGPVHNVAGGLVPELVAVADGQSRQVRTLVLHESAGGTSYLLLRGSSPGLADTAMTPPADAQQALSRVVAELTTPDANLSIDVAQQLSDFDIGYVLVQAPVNEKISGVLDSLTGLHRYSTTHGYTLWQLSSPPARVSLLEPNGTVLPIPSGPVGVSSARVPAAGGTLLLAEPATGWRASVNGHALAQVPSPAGSWAQAFRVPGGGGVLNLGYSGFGRDLVLLFELLAFIALAVLALPGIRVDADELAAGRDADRQAVAPGGRVDRRRQSGSPVPAAGTATRLGKGVAGPGEDDGEEELAAAGERAPSRLAARGAGLAGYTAGAGAARSLRVGRGRVGRKGTAARGQAETRDEADLAMSGQGRAGDELPRRDAPGRERFSPRRAGRNEAGRGEYGAGGSAGDVADRDGYGGGRGGRDPVDRAGYGAGRAGRDVVGRDGHSAGRGVLDRDGYGAGRGGRDALDRDRYSTGQDWADRDAFDSDGYGAGSSRAGDDPGDRDGYRGESADQGSSATAGRAGLGRRVIGRASRGRGGTDRAGAGTGAAGAIAGRRAAGREQESWRDRGDEPDQRLPDAWPYAASDTSRDHDRHDDARSYPPEDNRGGGRRGTANPYDNPYDTGDNRDSENWHTTSGRSGSDRYTSGGYTSDSYSSDSYSSDSYSSDSYSSDSYSSYNRSPSGRTPPGAWPYPASDELGPGSSPRRQSPSGRSPLPGDLSRSGTGSSSGSWRSPAGEDTGGGRGWGGTSEPPGGDAEPQRRGRRSIARHGGLRREGRSERGGQRAIEPPSWQGGDDALEPLPPPDSSRRMQGRRSTWAPADDDAYEGLYDDGPAGAGRANQRWSAPAPGYGADPDPDYDRGYEGDSW